MREALAPAVRARFLVGDVAIWFPLQMFKLLPPGSHVDALSVDLSALILNADRSLIHDGDRAADVHGGDGAVADEGAH